MIFIFAAEFSLFSLLISLILTGFVTGLATPVMPTLLSSEFVKERATAMGVYNFVRYLGMAAAPMIGSFLYPLGSIRLLIGVTTALIVISVFATSRLLQPKKEEVTNQN